MESSPSRFVVLPKCSELSLHQLWFLDENFREREDLEGALSLSSRLASDCSDLNDRLLDLRRDVTKLAVSWITCSFAAKSSMQNLSMKLEDLCLCTSLCGAASKAFQKRLKEELPQLAKELCRIEKIREYVDIALKLEALVGDLEDSVLQAANNHGGTLFHSKLQRVSTLTDFALRQERFNNAIKAMNEIEKIMLDVSKLQPQWHHILESVDTRVDKNFSVLRPQVIAEHRALLSSLGWPPKLTKPKVENAEASGIPNPLLLMQRDKKESYSQSFLVLCALQHIQMRREGKQLNLSKQRKIGLWAINELVLPMASRMEHHFIKWAEQPELIFALVYKVTKDFSDGVDDVLQPLVDKARLVSYSAKEVWISAMVQVVSGFLTKILFPELVERYKTDHLKFEVFSSWLHLVAHMIAFDKKMKALLSLESCFFLEDYERFEGLPQGISIMSIFCEKSEWLKTWTKIGLKDACRKLKEELKEEKAWLIGNNAIGVGFESDAACETFILSTKEEHKAPLAAELALKITWKFIEQCLTLPSIMVRTQFVKSTAMRFLWYFFKLLLLRFKKTDFSVNNPDETALIGVCGLINAARYIESKLQEWNDDLLFVEMKLAETGSKIHQKPKGLVESCFFEEEVKSLAELETSWLMEIITVLLRQFENLSWEYFQINEPLENVVLDSEDMIISHVFAEALDSLRRQLHVLQINLNSKDFLDLWRNLAEGLDHYISRSIFSGEVCFPRKWIHQFETDVRAVFLVFQPFCTRPRAFFPCARETLRLLNLSEEEVKHLQRHLQNDKKATSCSSFVGVSHMSNQQVEKLLGHYKLRTENVFAIPNR